MAKLVYEDDSGNHIILDDGFVVGCYLPSGEAGFIVSAKKFTHIQMLKLILATMGGYLQHIENIPMKQEDKISNQINDILKGLDF